MKNQQQYTLKDFIEGDLCRYTGTQSLAGFSRVFFKKMSFQYMVWFRLSQSKNWIIRKIARNRYRRMSLKHGIQIPIKTKIDPGFYIGHCMSIVINSSATIGTNCNISQFTTIGSNHGNAAKIGNNVYIGPNTCIVENVKIGNNSIIGAGSVVVKDVPENSTVAGNPAAVISMKEPGRYILNRFIKKN